MSARQEPGNVVAVTPADKTALVEARLQSRQEQDRMLRDVAAPYLSPEQLDAFAAQQEQASALTLAILRAGSGQGSRPALRPE